jgi:hypothetical protein
MHSSPGRLILLLLILVAIPAHSEEYYRSDIITPGGGNKYEPNSIRWGMSKTMVKGLLLKIKREPIIEAPHWLLIETGSFSRKHVRKYAFTNADKLAFVEAIETLKTEGEAEDYFAAAKKIIDDLHGTPYRDDMHEVEWEKATHGILLKFDYANNAVYSKSYDKHLSFQYAREIDEQVIQGIPKSQINE